MLTSNDYRELAARCTELASESSDPIVAEALRTLASDYLARAAQLLASIRRHHGSDEQMLGANKQIPRERRSD